MTTLTQFWKELLTSIDTLDYEVGGYNVEVSRSWWRGKELIITKDGDEVFRCRL